jgi:hypothetical protein
MILALTLSKLLEYDLRADLYYTIYYISIYKINGTFTSIDTLHKFKKRVKYYVFFWGSCLSIFSFCVMCCRSSFILFLVAMVLSVFRFIIFGILVIKYYLYCIDVCYIQRTFYTSAHWEVCLYWFIFVWNFTCFQRKKCT